MDPTPASGYRAFSSKTAETNYRDCAAVPDWALDTPEVDSSSLVSRSAEFEVGCSHYSTD